MHESGGNTDEWVNCDIQYHAHVPRTVILWWSEPDSRNLFLGVSTAVVK
jgi:hypothetical protein